MQRFSSKSVPERKSTRKKNTSHHKKTHIHRKNKTHENPKRCVLQQLRSRGFMLMRYSTRNLSFKEFASAQKGYDVESLSTDCHREATRQILGKCLWKTTHENLETVFSRGTSRSTDRGGRVLRGLPFVRREELSSGK